MKQLIFSLVLFLGLMMIGCQENSITDPNPAGSDLKASTNSPSLTSGTLALEGILKVPGTLNTYYTVKGKIDYTTESASPVRDASPNRFNVAVTLAADAAIGNSEVPYQRQDHIPWYISANSKDQVNTSVDGKYTMVKVYQIQGRTDGMVLVVKFKISPSSVRLESKWLSFPGSDSDAAPSTN